MIRNLRTILLACLALTSATAKEYWAPNYDVDATIEAGGSLLIAETVTFAFRTGPFHYVWRDLPLNNCDGIAAGEPAGGPECPAACGLPCRQRHLTLAGLAGAKRESPAEPGAWVACCRSARSVDCGLVRCVPGRG